MIHRILPLLAGAVAVLASGCMLPLRPAGPRFVLGSELARAPVGAAEESRGTAERGEPYGIARIPGATLSGIGEVRALVIPLSLGNRMPRLSEAEIAAYFEGAIPGEGSLSAVLDRESGGGFRLSAEVVPLLAHPASTYERRPIAPRGARGLVLGALKDWARELDLRRFDNDGADGRPGSGDDDSTLDLVFVTVESELGFDPFTIPEGLAFSTAGRRMWSGPIHVIPARAGALPELRVPLDQVLASLGLSRQERFFPDAFPRALASVGRARLGWLDLVTPPSEGSLALDSGQAVLLPLVDLPDHAGYWLVEREGRSVIASRIVRDDLGHFEATEYFVEGPGATRRLPLSYRMGLRGPTAELAWKPGEAAPEVGLTEGRSRRRSISGSAAGSRLTPR